MNGLGYLERVLEHNQQTDEAVHANMARNFRPVQYSSIKDYINLKSVMKLYQLWIYPFLLVLWLYGNKGHWLGLTFKKSTWKTTFCCAL